MAKGKGKAYHVSNPDEEGDQQHHDDIEMESDHPPLPTQPHHCKRAGTTIPTTAKGKGKATSKPSPLPDEARGEVQKFGDEVMEAAEDLAQWWSTSRHNVLVAAGLMLCESRALNPANKHAEWYVCHFPKADNGKQL